MTRLLALVTLLALLLPAFAAAGPAEVERLNTALATEEVISIMAEEGRAYSVDLLPEGAPAEWPEQLDRIYDTSRMSETYDALSHHELDGAELGPILAYFESPEGQNVVALEVSARRAMLDPDIEESARNAARQAWMSDSDRTTQIDRFIRVNDLIERNVESGLNSNFAFLAAVSDGGAGGAMAATESDLLREVWQGEPDLRRETIDWLRAYLLLAYGSLTDDELETYISASETVSGQEALRGNFAAFDALFRQQSRALGMAVASHLSSSEL